MSREETRIALAFKFTPGAGSILFKRCLEAFGDASAIAGASIEALAEIDRMPRAFAEAWQNKAEALARADREIALADEKNVQILTLFDGGYPESLKNIADPPIALYVKGHLAAVERRVAIVGSRETSPYGEKNAAAFARDFAEAGVAVVSGLAHGIDSAAHRGAVDANGVTWAVLGGGLLNGGSYRNPRLADDVLASGGAIFSEYPLRATPRPEYYPQRNRIVSGLTAATIVVEAGRQSGALITAGLALDQGRDVFALPGPVDSIFSEGSNWLLRQGAKLVCSAADVLEDLGWLGETAPVLETAFLTDDEKGMMKVLSVKKPLHLDDWIEQSGRPNVAALELIGSLVLKGAVAERPGKYYALGKK